MAGKPAAGPQENGDGAQSVRRAMAVLRLVATGQERGVRMTDVAAMAGLSRPTVHRLLKVLMEETAVEQDPATRRYRVGSEIALLGLARPGSLSIRAVAEPYLPALAAEVGDTVFLSVRHGNDSVCVGRYLGSHPIQVLSIDVGARRPLGASVSGIVLLSGLPQEEAARIALVNEARLDSVDRSPKEVLAAADTARRQGFIYAPKGVMPGTRAVAVPVVDGSGTLVAAISLATLAERLPRERVRSVVGTMQAHVARVTARLAEIERARNAARRATE